MQTSGSRVCILLPACLLTPLQASLSATPPKQECPLSPTMLPGFLTLQAQQLEGPVSHSSWACAAEGLTEQPDFYLSYCELQSLGACEVLSAECQRQSCARPRMPRPKAVGSKEKDAAFHLYHQLPGGLMLNDF